MTDESLSSTVHQEMSQWFGDKQTADWKLLKMYRVPFAQPNQVGQTHSVSLNHSCIDFVQIAATHFFDTLHHAQCGVFLMSCSHTTP